MEAVLGTQNIIDPEIGVNTTLRFLGFLIIFFLLVTAALTLIRLGALPFAVLARTFVLILLFGYIATHSLTIKESSKISPISFSTISNTVK